MRRAVLLATLMLACGSEPPVPVPSQASVPAGEAAPAPEPRPRPEPAPEPEPRPEPKLVEPVAVPAAVTHCIVAVEGEGPRMVKAAIRAHVPAGAAPDIREGSIEGENGRTVRYDCPEPRQRQGVDLIVELENDEVVHWKGVSVDEAGEGKVIGEEGIEGLPADLSPEELEILAQQRGISVEEVVAETAKLRRAPRRERSSEEPQPSEEPAPSEPAASEPATTKPKARPKTQAGAKPKVRGRAPSETGEVSP